MILDSGCGMLDGNGNFVLVPSGTLTAVLVETSSGVFTRSCQATLPNATGTAVHWTFANTGRLCGQGAGFPTTQWVEIVSPSGQATLSCHFNSPPSEHGP